MHIFECLLFISTWSISGCDGKPVPEMADMNLNVSVWPQPTVFSSESVHNCIVPNSFHFELLNQPQHVTVHSRRLGTCMNYVNSLIATLFEKSQPTFSRSTCAVTACSISVKSFYAKMTDEVQSEMYEIEFSGGVPSGASFCSLSCDTVYGCMRGLFTFLQLLDPTTEYRVPNAFHVNDTPAFPHRGLLIDTGRHFLPIAVIENHLRLMAMSKMNVFHWHIVDETFPLNLTGASVNRVSEGALSPSAVYSKEDIRRIVELGDSLGIRVIPEIDMPGHTTGWRKAYPELTGNASHAIDPTREENFKMVEDVLTEVVAIFRSNIYAGPMVVHLGGDELGDGWATGPILAWAAERGMGSVTDLMAYWVRRIMAIAKKLHIRVIMWEDFLRSTGDRIDGFQDGENPIVWETWLRGFNESIELSANVNRKLIYASSFYLDNLALTWPDFYNERITPARGVLGAEASIWGDSVDETNSIQRVWPRTAALAERLWCGPRCSHDHRINAVMRLARWRCRMRFNFGFRGIEPVGREFALNPHIETMYHTDLAQWWCAEHDALNTA
jgi:hexosaminidase